MRTRTKHDQAFWREHHGRWKQSGGSQSQYCREQRLALLRYLENSRAAIDNNIVERDIKRVIMGRKAWLFSDTPAGMHASATLYSLVQTCIANEVDPYKYFVTVIERFPAARTFDDLLTLLPWALKAELDSRAVEFSGPPEVPVRLLVSDGRR